jgi:hypothetical protein
VSIFADTFYWVALLNLRDSANRAVLEFSRTLGSSTLITTDEVLIEFLAFCASDQQLRIEAALTVQDILDGGNVHVVAQSHAG